MSKEKRCEETENPTPRKILREVVAWDGAVSTLPHVLGNLLCRDPCQSRASVRAAMGRKRNLLSCVRLGRESNNKSTGNCNERGGGLCALCALSFQGLLCCLSEVKQSF